MSRLDVLHLLLEACVAFGAVFAGLQSLINRGAIHEVHVILNSRLDQLLNAAQELARMQGAREQRAADAAEKNGKTQP